MRYDVIMTNGVDSMYAPDRECVASLLHEQHAKGFCDRLSNPAYVVDRFDDSVIHENGKG